MTFATSQPPIEPAAGVRGRQLAGTLPDAPPHFPTPPSPPPPLPPREEPQPVAPDDTVEKRIGFLEGVVGELQRDTAALHEFDKGVQWAIDQLSTQRNPLAEVESFGRRLFANPRAAVALSAVLGALTLFVQGDISGVSFLVAIFAAAGGVLGTDAIVQKTKLESGTRLEMMRQQSALSIVQAADTRLQTRLGSLARTRVAFQPHGSPDRVGSDRAL